MKRKIFLSLVASILLFSCNNEGSSSEIISSSETSQLKIEESDKTITNISSSFSYNDMLDGSFDTSLYYRNDLKTVNLPDPFVYEEDGIYYIYGTTDRTGSVTLDCYETLDFNEYVLHTNISLENEDSWSNCAERSRFAPELIKYEDTYYLYYSDVSKETGRRYINVMTSDSPVGPFVEFEDGARPCFTHNDTIGLDVLDQHVFIDDDGSMYMYYSVYQTDVMQYIIGVKLISPTEADWSTYKELIYPGEINASTKTTNKLLWEALKGFKVAEGPFMIKSPVNGKYYLTYSVNHYPDRYYSVCYAVSDSPLGDYNKPYIKDKSWTNLLFGYAGSTSGNIYNQWEGFMSGTAHHCFFKSGNEWMIGFHAHKNRKDGARAFGIDHLYFAEDGTPFTQGPTYSIQPLPNGITGLNNLITNASIATEGITNEEGLNDNFVAEHYQLPSQTEKEVILQAGKSYVKIKFEEAHEIKSLLVYTGCNYENALIEDISFINFGNDNVIEYGTFNYNYLNDDSCFIFPCSAYTFDLETKVVTDTIVICFDCEKESHINEIKVLGR